MKKLTAAEKSIVKWCLILVDKHNIYTCRSLADHDWELAKRYAEFFGKRPTDVWFSRHRTTDEERLEYRLTALTLFLVANS